MPRYFFDVETADRQVQDEIGMDLPNAHAIWPEIARLISDCILTVPPTEEGRVFNVTVRNKEGCVVERSTTSVPPIHAERSGS